MAALVLLVAGGGLCSVGCATQPATSPSVSAPASVSAAVAASGTATRPAPPRLLVTIVVDQLAAWIASERWPALPPDGGFARLRREGLYVRELRYDHAVNDTAPGHSALYTGAVPRDSGIIGNELVTSDKGEMTSILADPATRLVVTGVSGPSDKPASSLAALRVETLADGLAASDAQATIYSFSLKDRGALFAAGRHPTLALWLEPAEEAFVTSTAFAGAIPAWVTPLAGREAVRAALAAPWELLDRDWVAAHATTRDDQAGEGDYAGLGTTFPHHIHSAKALRATPAGDDLLFSLARGALAQAPNAPASGHPTLLALSLSSNDYVGHMFGPDSWEAWDQLRRLDQKLGAFLTFLDHTVGPASYAVMLTGDHGIGAIPELEAGARAAACARGGNADPARAPGDRSCPPARRLMQSQLTTALEQAARRALASAADRTGGGAGGSVEASAGSSSPGWIAGIADPLVFLTARARALSAPQRARLVQAARQALVPFGIDDVVDIHAATAPCPAAADQSRAALVCRSVWPQGPADLYLVVSPRAFFDARYTPGSGAHHGSPYLYDRAVPLLVRAPGRVSAGTVRESPVSFTAFARTAGALLGVPAPAAARDGEDLTAPAAPAP
jgi:hypothetical protein